VNMDFLKDNRLSIPLLWVPFSLLFNLGHPIREPILYRSDKKQQG